jgi:hypothetical protein
MRLKPGRLVILGAGVALTVTASALAAHCRPCHPDPFGTRLLTIPGTVDRYFLNGSTVRVEYQPGGSCTGSFTWRAESAPLHVVAPSACSRGGAPRLPFQVPPRELVAVDGTTLVRVVRAPTAADLPDRLVVVDQPSGRTLHSWPLLDTPVTLSVRDGIAVFSAAGHRGLYSVRLSDGRIAVIGINQARDMPQISSRGVAYEDDLYKLNDGKGRILLKFVPMAAITHELAIAGRPIRTDGHITSFAMDGPRVALAIRNQRGRCDRVRFWNIPWSFSAQVSQDSGPTCTPGRTPVRITDIRIAGYRAEWLARSVHGTNVIAASSISCQEWVLNRLRNGTAGDQISGLGGSGPTLAFAVTRHQQELRGLSSVSVLHGRSRTRLVAAGRFVPVALAADGMHLAILRSNGSVDLRQRDGRSLRHIVVGHVRALALRGDRLVTIDRAGMLDVFDVSKATLTRRWPLPRGASAKVDLHFGVAVFTARRDVYALDVETGRTVRVAHAPARARAEVDAPGIVYAYNLGAHGYARFIPFAQVEALMR